jgi:invasion protein IalB
MTPRVTTEGNMDKPSFGRKFSPLLLGLSVAMMAVAGTAGGVRAELSDSERAAQKPTEAEVGPRGRHMPRDIQYSAWRKVCFKAPDAKMVCRTTSEGTWDTGQLAVRVDLIEREGGSGRLQIFLPVGLYLQPGVKATIDQGVPVQVPYSWCLSNLCIAATPAGPDLIGAMDSGQKLMLEVVDANILTIPTTLSLDQFATTRKGPPTQIFEYQFDNP